MNYIPSFGMMLSRQEYNEFNSKIFNIRDLFENPHHNKFLNWLISKIRILDHVHILHPQIECPPSFEKVCREKYASFCQRNNYLAENSETYNIFKMIVYANEGFKLYQLVDGTIEYWNYDPSIIKTIHHENVQNGTHDTVILNLILTIPQKEIPPILFEFEPSTELINADLMNFVARNSTVIFPDNIKARWHAFEYASSHHCLDQFIRLKSFMNEDSRFRSIFRSIFRNRVSDFNNVWDTSSQKNLVISTKNDTNQKTVNTSSQPIVINGTSQPFVMNTSSQPFVVRVMMNTIESRLPNFGARFEAIVSTKNDTNQKNENTTEKTVNTTEKTSSQTFVVRVMMNTIESRFPNFKARFEAIVSSM